MSFKFRLAFRLGPQCGLDGVGDSAEISLGAIAPSALLRGLGPADPREIKTSKLFDIVADGFPTHDAAARAGDATRDALLRVALAQGFELDCGLPGEDERAGVTDHFKRIVKDKTGTILGDHALGVAVYPSAPLRVLIGANINLRRGVPHSAFSDRLASELAPGTPLPAPVALAIQAWCRAGFVESRTVRFLLLCNAVECLIVKAPVAEPLQTAVTAALAAAETCGLPAEDCTYFRSRLHDLRRESINRAGQRIALERLAGNIYNKLPPDAFFKASYDVRSKLVHAGSIALSDDEFRELSGAYSQFARDLIRAHLAV